MTDTPKSPIPEPERSRGRAGARPLRSRLAENPGGGPHFAHASGVNAMEGERPGSRIVEVEFRADASDLAARLAGDPRILPQESVSNAAVPDAWRGVADVLRRYGVEESATSFPPEQIEADREERRALELSERMSAYPPLESFVRLRFATPDDAAAAANALRELPGVERAQVVPRARPPQPPRLPEDELIGTAAMGVNPFPGTFIEPQWYLHRTFVPDAWALGARGKGVVIADIDWGYLTTHQDLRDRLEMEFAFNAADGSNDVSQGGEIGHGTAVLGIAGAAADGAGMAGYAPEADLWPLQGNSDTVTEPSFDPWARAIEHVRTVDSGGRRKVIMLEVHSENGRSWEQIPAVREAVRRAIDSDVVVCVAAGNGDAPADVGDDGQPFEPTGSIVVGATAWHEQHNRRAHFSNWGPSVVVSAPGDSLHDLTCAEVADDKYRNDFGGTSGATPKVAGTVALMLSVNSALKHDEIREILRETGSAIVPDEDVPHKVVGTFLNTGEAVRRARPVPA